VWTWVLAGKWQALLGAVVSIPLSIYGPAFFKYQFDLQLSTNNRIAEMQIVDFRNLQDQISEFNSLTNSFTRALIKGESASAGQQEQIVYSLAKQYDRVQAFDIYIREGDKPVLKEYMTTINQMRKTVLDTNSKEDLNEFYMQLKNYVTAQKAMRKSTSYVRG
jgi:hypothetical protein